IYTILVWPLIKIGWAIYAAREGESVEMERREQAEMTVEAELRVPVATLQLVQYLFVDPVAGDMREDQDYRLDLSLTSRPRNARACYPDRWAPHRFERLGSVW